MLEELRRLAFFNVREHRNQPDLASPFKGTPGDCSRATRTPAEPRSAHRGRRRRAFVLQRHDLRREAGSRWLEGGVPLQVVREWLGHSNISQTSTYLESTLTGQHDAMRRFEAARALQSVRQAATADAVQGACNEASDTGVEGGSTVQGGTKNPQQCVN